jgi:hypothetical protein
VSSCRTFVDFVLFDALCNTSTVPPFAFFTLKCFFPFAFSLVFLLGMKTMVMKA